MLTTLTHIIIGLLGLFLGWKVRGSYNYGEGILEGYQIGYRDAVRNYAEAKLEQMKPKDDDLEFVEHDGVDYQKPMLN